MPIFADSNRARVRVIKEDPNAWGATPPTGVSRELRYTGSTLNAAKNTTMSEEIRADRMVSQIVEVGANSAGEINIEFSAGSHDDLLEGFMYGAWSRAMTFDSVKGPALEFADADTLLVKGVDVTDYFFAGRRIRTNGFKSLANNDYFQISAISFNGGANRTEITLTAATAVAERGSNYTAMYDANDVVVLKNTSIRAGTAGASAFDSNGANAFAAAIAAGQLAAGQKVFVEGLGFETGTVTFTDLPAAGSKVRVTDGADNGDKSLVFQIGGGPYAQTVVGVDLASDVDSLAENFADAVNAERVKGNIRVSASAAAGVVTLTNLNPEGSTGGLIAEELDTGNDITVASFSGGDVSLRGVFTVTSATDDVLSVEPAPSTFANAGSRPVTIKASMLRNPSDVEDIIPQSFTFETGFEDVSQYFLADGQRIGAFSYNIASQAILTGSFSLQGRAMTRRNSTKLGAAPYTALETTSTPVGNATVNVGSIAVNGDELSTALQSITLSGNNNLREQNAVGYKFPAGIGAGRQEITGSVVAYFADGQLWDKFIEHATVSLNFAVQDDEGHRYEFTVPAANFSTDTANPPGLNQDILENLEFMAKRDPATGCQIQVDRFSCILPVTA